MHFEILHFQLYPASNCIVNHIEMQARPAFWLIAQ